MTDLKEDGVLDATFSLNTCRGTRAVAGGGGRGCASGALRWDFVSEDLPPPRDLDLADDDEEEGNEEEERDWVSLRVRLGGGGDGGAGLGAFSLTFGPGADLA